jgi:hypothetical protein
MIKLEELKRKSTPFHHCDGFEQEKKIRVGLIDEIVM